MNKYMKLVRFELNRFWNFYLILIGITIALQMIGVIVLSKEYVAQANQIMYQNFLSPAQFMTQYNHMSFQQRMIESLWFMGPVMICGVTLAIYVFFIWYRDWLGKNTLIYRLLMLPTTRMNLYFSKLTTVMLMVFGLVSVQMVLLVIENQILKSIIPAELRLDLPFWELHKFSWLTTIIPTTFAEWIIYYSIGLMAVCVVFTAVLFERSFRWKGIILAIIYSILSVLVFISPFIVHFSLDDYFYPAELLGLGILTGLIVTAGAVGTGHYLLRNKIRV
jgi:hypothetical protein